MRTLLSLLALAASLPLLPVSVRAQGDVPLTRAPVQFGPAPLDLVTGGVGLGTQPATFSVVVPEGATVGAAYLYVTGRGAGDSDLVLNGMAVTLPLIASGGSLPFDATQSVETRRIAVPLVTGVNAFTIDGYEQRVPGGAFVVGIVNDPAAPLRTVTLLEGADYAFSGFAPPFGPDTETGAFTFAAATTARFARLLLFTHDTRANRGDATWLLAADSATVPVPLDLVGGSGDADRVQRNRLGVSVGSGGFARGAQFDIFDRSVAIPAGADYLAFQVESADELVDAESLALSVAALALPAADGDGGGGGSTTTTTPTSSSSSTTLPGSGGADVPPNCGDGVLDLDEECDDGNRAGGDGCDAACAAEDTSETWEIFLRVRPKGVEHLRYFTLLHNVPSALLGTAPVHITLSSRGFQMLDAELPASAFRVKPQPTLAQADGRLAKAEGDFGIWHIKLRLKPVTGIRAYDAKLVVEGEMLPDMFGMLHLTAVIRVGDVVYTATDRVRADRTGKLLHYIHPVLDD